MANAIKKYSKIIANAIAFCGIFLLKSPNFAIYDKNMANAILFTWQMLSVLMANA